MKTIILFLTALFAALTAPKAIPYEGDLYDGELIGNRGFDVPAINLGDFVEVQHIPRPISDLDGDPLSDEEYLEADLEDDELTEGALFKRKNKKAKASGPKVKIRKSAKASNIPAAVANNAIQSEINSQKAMDSVPGSRLAKNQLLPFLSLNGAVDAPPTTVPLEGQNVFASLTRYQTTYPALSYQKSTVSTGATITFTWADSDFSGGIGATPVIMLSHAASALNAASGAKYTVTVSGYDETGKALTMSAWAYRRKVATDRVLVYLIPYIEISSKLYPVILKVSSGKSLTVAVTGVPVDETVTSIMPGMNHADFLSFKELLQVK